MPAYQQNRERVEAMGGSRGQDMLTCGNEETLAEHSNEVRASRI